MTEILADSADEPARSTSRRRANDLNGTEWTRFSMSIWSDIRFTAEERRLAHPAMFPTMLVERLIRCFTTQADAVVLDPFMGSGSTLVAARAAGKRGVGFDVYEEFVRLAEDRLRHDDQVAEKIHAVVHNTDARRLSSILPPESVDFCVTSPPYWDILTRRRSADGKGTRNYGGREDDLGVVSGYDSFLDELQQVFAEVHKVLRPRKYCVVNVMDLRKGASFFPFHTDLAGRLVQAGFVFDDIIIWDRRQDYNNLRSLGFPSTFRINKVHEFLLIFLKPGAAPAAAATAPR